MNAARRQAAALTHSLVSGAVRYRAAKRDHRGPLEAALLVVAEERFVVLSLLLDDDPKAVVDAALPANIREKLPSSLNTYLEQDAEVDGTLAILHEDMFDGGRYHYVLHTPSGQYSLHFAQGAPSHLLTGAKIRVRGMRLADMLALGGGETSVQQLAPAPLPKTLGALRTLVILVNFSDNPAQPYTVDDAHAAMFGVTSSFFLENSYQQSWLDGDVYGWFTIPVSGAACDYTTIANAAQSAAVAAGANLTAYDHSSTRSRRTPVNGGGCPRSAARLPSPGSMAPSSWQSWGTSWGTASASIMHTRSIAERRRSAMS